MKFGPFYAAAGTGELLIVDRAPWQLELLRLSGGTLVSAGVSTTAGGAAVASRLLPFTFRLVAGQPRPRIEVASTEGEKSWLA